MSTPEPYFSDDMVTLHLGDCLDVLAGMEPGSVDAVVCDPPYALTELPVAVVTEALAAWLAGDRAYVPETGAGGFMGREWDKFVPPPAAWDQCMRVLKPGGHLLAFAAPRTQDLMGMSVRLAGFEIRDGLKWIFGQGYPKSLDVSKAIDRRRNDRPDILRVTSWLADIAEAKGVTRAQVDTHVGTSDMGGWWLSRLEHRCAVPTWEQWEKLRGLIGFGDEMDAEVWRLNGRKGEPGEAWADREVVGTGHRIRRESTVQIVGLSDGVYDITAAATEDASRWEGWGTALKPAHEPIIFARKPLADTVAANVLAFGTGGLNIDGCRVEHASDADLAASKAKNPGRADTVTSGVYGAGRPQQSVNDAGRWPPNVLLSEEAAAEVDRQSGVSRSIQGVRRGGGRTAKSDYRMRDQDRDSGYGDEGGASRYFPVFRYEAKAGADERPRLPDGTTHVTVKPVELVRWLVRLVTPPGGVVLDCFAGSGTTGEAAIIEGFRSVLIERDPKYAELITTRLRKPIQPDLFGGAA